MIHCESESMAEAVILPKQGNSVESCLIMTWQKQVGEPIQQGDILVQVETDKAVVEIESPTTGILLAAFFNEGDDVPVMTNIAVVGEQGEDIESFRPKLETKQQKSPKQKSTASKEKSTPKPTSTISTASEKGRDSVSVSPRARMLADQYGVNIKSITPTGPDGRIIERDVQALIDTKQPMTPAARHRVMQGDVVIPEEGSGVGGRITLADLEPIPVIAADVVEEKIEEVPLKGIRKTIADRMRSSLQQSAQVTLNASANAQALLNYRKRLKATDESLDLQNVSINDLLLYAVSRVLLKFPAVNATLMDDTIYQHASVHLGFAVDTERGLLVPVIRNAHKLTLKTLSQETSRLSEEAQAGSISADDLNGGTFTVSNLGSLGIETFTPIINPPQLAILGVGKIDLKPIQVNDTVEFIPHIHLSLTIDHQIIDGAPGARFLQTLTQALENIDLWLAQ